MANSSASKKNSSNFQVFISYSFEDGDIVRQLKNTLQQDGIKCYVAKHDANYGGSIYTKLSSAIDNSKAVIAILTQKGCASPSVNQELGYAKKAGKRIIPLVEKGVNLPVMLQGLEYKKFDRSSLDHTCIKISELLSKYFPRKCSRHLGMFCHLPAVDPVTSQGNDPKRSNAPAISDYVVTSKLNGQIFVTCRSKY